MRNIRELCNAAIRNRPFNIDPAIISDDELQDCMGGFDVFDKLESLLRRKANDLQN